MSFLEKFFGDSNKKVINQFIPIIKKINDLESEFQDFSDGELKNRTNIFKERIKNGETLDDILPEAFACVREASMRTIGERHFDVQLIGGIVLHQGGIAEMKTGEGKTLASTLAIYLNALEGKGVHVVTVNDYLAKRDTNWMGSIYHFLGLNVAGIQHNVSYLYDPKTEPDRNEVTVEMDNLREISRREAYEADITYGTNNEFGFDFLRDNMVYDLSQSAQRDHHYAVIDEVDSILIDEARTPLIISAPDEESTKKYQEFSHIVPRLKENTDYNIDEKMKAVTLTEEGVNKVEKILEVGNIYEERGIREVHHLEQALRAQILFKKDIDYIVKDGEVIIVDQFTGRLMPGRRYSEGLHQAIEAKEGVEVQKESKTLATTTFQNYFRMYKKLAGMTGTAATNAEEFDKVYKLDTVIIPTNKSMVRIDMPDSIYRTEKGKFQAIIREIKNRNEKGQPVLVGTIAIEKSELLSQFLKREGVTHEVLNAKNHEREAQIIAKAGQRRAVTIATNMAGRGTDIKLGDGVKDLGGLHILGTERHEARRIDNQLRGRAGRQGDPGSSQFFVSMEDDLTRIFGADKIKRMMAFLKIPEDTPIENRIVSRAIESAQSKIEGYNFDIRKHVLEYDDVMNKHREVIYAKRKRVLQNKERENKIMLLDMICDEIKKIVEFHTRGEISENWNIEEVAENIKAIMPVPENLHSELMSKKDIAGYLIDLANKNYEDKEKEVSEENMRQLEKFVLLRTIDSLWMEHLDEMDHVRDAVRLRAYGQRDPLVEYKNEAHKAFRNLLATVQVNVVNTIFKITVAKQSPASVGQTTNEQSIKSALGRAGISAQPNSQAKSAVAVTISPKSNVGRNDPCSCGSGKKYKRCHGK
jgi:preprotein translocase subunit SecA